MKALFRLVLPALIGFFAFTANAQSGNTTIILVRHAEKDSVSEKAQMMKNDPPLSAEGKARAMRLVTVLEGFTPTEIYTTNYKRTMATIAPIADVHQLSFRFYDPRNQQTLAEQLRSAGEKTIIVAGHSNSIPRLVNLLLGEEKFADLDDSVYNKIFIVRIAEGKAVVEVREY